MMDRQSSCADAVSRTSDTTQSKIDVSFVINNYNYDRFLTDAITSALNQIQSDSAISLNIEVVVVDDGSTDSSKVIISHFSDHIHSVLKNNGGQASAFNAGFAASRGEWVCFLDADDYAHPNKALSILKTAQQYPQAEWIFHTLQPVDEYLQPLTPTCDRYGATWVDLRTQLTKGKFNPKTLPFGIPATSALCIRRSLLTQILPMPESDGITLNDSYLQYAALGNRPGIFLNLPLAAQRHHGQNSFINTSKPQLNARIMVLTAYWLRHKFPHLALFSNSQLSLALAHQWLSNQPLPIAEQRLMKTYFKTVSWPDRIYLYLKAFYYFIRA